MPTENPFRIALVIVILLTMVVTVYHRLQAAKSGERITHKDEGYPKAATENQSRSVEQLNRAVANPFHSDHHHLVKEALDGYDNSLLPEIQDPQPDEGPRTR